MSNPLLMEIADLQEINAGIVKRQRAALELLEQAQHDQYRADIQRVIDTLKGVT